MIKGKRAGTPGSIIALMILSIVAFTVIQFILLTFGQGAGTAKGDAVCIFSNDVTGRGGVLGNLAPEFLRVSGNICPTQLATIVPDDFDKCDKQFEFEFKSGLRQSAMRKCTAQQIADLMHRCWTMGGRGRLDPGSWSCFNLHIMEPKKEDFENLAELEREVREELDPILDCRGQADRQQCELDKETLIDLVIRRMALSAVITYYKDDLAVSSIALCLTENEEELPAEDVFTCGDVQLPDGTVQPREDCDLDSVLNEYDHCPSTLPADSYVVGVQGCSPNELYEAAEAAVPSSPSGSDYELALSGKVKEDEALCGDKLYEKLVTSKDKVATAKAKIDNIINPNISNILDDYVAFDRLPEALEKTFKFSSTVPKVGEITRDFMLEVMQNTINPATEVPYCNNLPCDSNYEQDIKLTTRALFEIAFCDPPAQLGSGFVGKCKSRGFGDQALIIAPAATGLGRAGSPYPEMCKILNVDSKTRGAAGPLLILLSDDSDEQSALANTCRTVVRGAFGD